MIRTLDRGIGGALSVLTLGTRNFMERRATEAAASMAYYAVFSLFPLLLVAVAIGSSALQSESARDQVLDLLSTVIPVSADLIRDNIEQVLDRRGTIGLLGAVGLLWSASGVFTALVNHINRAWPSSEPRGFLSRRFLGIAVIGALVVGLLLLWFISNVALNIIPELGLFNQEQAVLFGTFAWRLASTLVPFLFTLFMFLALYHWVPTREVRWSEAFWGALVASLGWTLVSDLFSLYLRSGLANYNLIYGSLGAIVALMFWIYLSSLIVLFGAHISAAVTRYRESGGPFNV